jgi:hypothetical protein
LVVYSNVIHPFGLMEYNGIERSGMEYNNVPLLGFEK